MLPTVDFCGLKVTRLILGANPFGGYSHQTRERDEEMRSFHTPERIIETLHRARAAGINTVITNNGSPNVMEALRRYFAEGGGLQWIAQVSNGYREGATMIEALDEAAEMGAKAVYTHGARTDAMYREQDVDQVTEWMERIRSHGVPAGVAAHAFEVHDWVNELGVADFHTVCFFRCGSIHDGKGTKFRLRDLAGATACIRRIEKPCIGYKIMGAGRIAPLMALEYAFDSIKPGDVVNVGMHRGDKDDIIEENVATVREILGVE